MNQRTAFCSVSRASMNDAASHFVNWTAIFCAVFKIVDSFCHTPALLRRRTRCADLTSTLGLASHTPSRSLFGAGGVFVTRRADCHLNGLRNRLNTALVDDNVRSHFFLPIGFFLPFLTFFGPFFFIPP